MSDPDGLASARRAHVELSVRLGAEPGPGLNRLPLSPNQRARRRFVRNQPALGSAVFLGALLLVVLVGPLLCPYQPELSYAEQFQPPDAKHWFGTDVHGRDLLSRVLFGVGLSILVGVVGTAAALVIGVSWGAEAG